MKKEAPKISVHRRSVEKLHHFRCGTCGKWWTIGDAPAGRKKWFCPWCGAKQTANKIS